jgi:hypothetical protein
MVVILFEDGVPTSYKLVVCRHKLVYESPPMAGTSRKTELAYGVNKYRFIQHEGHYESDDANGTIERIKLSPNASLSLIRSATN